MLHKTKSDRTTSHQRIDVLVASYILSAIITFVVYLTGGTITAYPNLMYIPISIVGSTYGKKHGVIHAVISALMIGPFMPLDIGSNVKQAVANWVLRIIIYAIIGLVIGFISDYRKQEFDNSTKKDKEIVEAQMAMIFSLVKLAESRDDNTGAHIERVAEFCKLLAEKMRDIKKYENYIHDDYIENIHEACPLHDIGKVGIPDSILLKPGRLTADEFEIMKQHTTIGASTLGEVKKKYPDNKFLELGISITLYHHEKWDGTGYPEGLSGTEIPLSARIMAIADVYDALRSKRVYKKANSHEESIEIIKEGRGTHFDPDIVDVFLENEAELNRIFEIYSKV